MNDEATLLGRRAFLKDGSLVLAATSLDLMTSGSLLADEKPSKGGVKVGLITDLHYADKPPAGTRHYRETLNKLAEAAKQFEKEKPTFMVELGDLIDAAASEATEQKYLKRVNKEFAGISKDRHYVLGNHCVDILTKEEFLGAVGQKRSYYSFDRGGVHFVVLDACFRSDGKPYGRKNSKWNDANIPTGEVDWLKDDLKKADEKVVVFVHQRLDVANDYRIKNAAEVRKVLEASGKVLAVFQGHSHKNDYKEVGGVHYCTLVAMVEGAGAANNGYSTMNVQSNGTITLAGFRKQKGHEWVAKK
jgi:alkaline phosphatase